MGNIILNCNSESGFNGLVMCGGSSTRMGEDKSLLIYHSIPQRDHVYQMLEPFCERVFLSCNETQAATSFPVLLDNKNYINCGPIAGILSAFDLFPYKDLMIAGCDYPFLRDRDMADMLALSQGNTTAFYNEEAELYEPILAYYSRNDAGLLRELFHEGQHSLLNFLNRLNARKFYPRNKNSIKSADTKADFISSKTIIDAY